ncbi:MAG: NAD(P)-binding domain-containing protein, partial [Solirubrobacteraceae bacterium]|nr:NAD(P)-binding domain-containing protein [Solirubrobacteraceae bacterium]
PETLADLVAELGPNATAGTPEEAIAHGDILIVTVPLKAVADLPTDGTAGKTLIDTCNYYPERDGQFAAIDDGSTTESELVAAHFSEANVVKAFNSIYFVHLAEQGKPASDATRRGIPIAGDSATAKLEVSQLIDQIGFEPVDAGSLPSGRLFENGADLYGAELTGPDLAKALADAAAAS